MRLLVDGLNTLPQKDVAKGVETYEWANTSKTSATPEPGFWTPPVQGDADRRPTNVGFSRLRQRHGRTWPLARIQNRRSRKITRRKTTIYRRVGLITAAFYTPKAGPRGVGTGLATSVKKISLKGILRPAICAPWFTFATSMPVL